MVLWHPGEAPANRPRSPAWPPPAPSRCEFVRAVVQHDDQPGAPDGPGAGAPAAGAVVCAVSGRPVGGRPGPRYRARRADARRDRRRARWTDAPILEYARLRAQIIRAGARPGARVAAAAAAGRQRRVGRAAPRRHHHHHPRPPRRAGRGAGICPRQRRPAAVGADRKPLGGADLVGRLFGRVGAGRDR